MKRRLAVVALALLGGLLALEAGFRVLEGRLGLRGHIGDARLYLLEGTMREYEPDAHTVFRRPRGEPGFNALGFRGPEWPLARTPGVPRILCLGASTTESFGPASYPSLLEDLLEQRTGRDFEVLVAGVSGWTSAEGLVAWFLTLQDYRPDLLLIHFAVNDVGPRLGRDFRSDYSHWRRPLRGGSARAWDRLLAPWSDLYVHLRARTSTLDIQALTAISPRRFDPLVEQGRLDPASALPFRRNIRSIAESARSLGASVALMTMPLAPGPVFEGDEVWRHGAAEHSRHLRELAAEQGYLLVDAEGAFAGRPELAAEFVDLVHLRRRGNQVKAELAARVLLEDWIPSLPADGARAPGVKLSTGSPPR